MSKLKDIFIELFTERTVKEAIEKSQGVIKRAEFLLNGEDDWLTIRNVCPSDKPDKKECPPEFIKDDS